MKIGPYVLSTIDAGAFRLDGGAMFGVVPKVLWEKTNPADELNRIQMALRSLLISGNGRNILVDTGIGNFWQPKHKKIYAIERESIIDDSLRGKKLTREDITDVIISHLHFDHVGGVTRKVGDKIEMTFPNAKIHVHKKNLDHAHAPTEKDKASFWENSITPLFKSKQLNIIDDNYEYAPGILAWITHGHTPGHQLVKVSDGKTTAIFCGDTIPTTSHISIPWVMAYDLEPLKTMEEKRKLYERAVPENWTLIFVHDPKIAACKVIQSEGRFQKGETIPL